MFRYVTYVQCLEKAILCPLHSFLSLLNTGPSYAAIFCSAAANIVPKNIEMRAPVYERMHTLSLPVCTGTYSLHSYPCGMFHVCVVNHVTIIL